MGKIIIFLNLKPISLDSLTPKMYTLTVKICHYSDNRRKDMGSRVISAHWWPFLKKTCLFLKQSVISLVS